MGAGCCRESSTRSYDEGGIAEKDQNLFLPDGIDQDKLSMGLDKKSHSNTGMPVSGVFSGDEEAALKKFNEQKPAKRIADIASSMTDLQRLLKTMSEYSDNESTYLDQTNKLVTDALKLGFGICNSLRTLFAKTAAYEIGIIKPLAECFRLLDAWRRLLNSQMEVARRKRDKTQTLSADNKHDALLAFSVSSTNIHTQLMTEFAQLGRWELIVNFLLAQSKKHVMPIHNSLLMVGQTARETPTAKDEQVMNKLYQFILDEKDAKDNNSMLVCGDGGTGKTIMLLHAMQDWSKKYIEGGSAFPIPVFVDVSRNPSVHNALTKLGLDMKQIEVFRKEMESETFVFLFDNYDSAMDVNLASVNHLEEWSGTVKMITSCATLFNGNQYIENTKLNASDKLTTMFLSHILADDRNMYIAKFVNDIGGAWTHKMYVEQLGKIKGAMEFCDTIYKLEHVLKALPRIALEHRSITSFARLDGVRCIVCNERLPAVYCEESKEYYCNHRSCQKVHDKKPEHVDQQLLNFLGLYPVLSQTSRLDFVDIVSSYVDAYFRRHIREKWTTEIPELYNISDIQVFAEEFSHKLHENRMTSVNEPWKYKGFREIFSPTNAVAIAMRAASMITRIPNSNIYEFESRVFQDYFLSCAITRNLREGWYSKCPSFSNSASFETKEPNGVASSFNFREAFHNNEPGFADRRKKYYQFTPTHSMLHSSPNGLKNSALNSDLTAEVLQFLAGHTRNSTDWMVDALLLVVYASRSTGVIDIAASNALTILNLSRQLSFSRMDFSNCKLPYAQLPSAVLANTNFNYANLSNANFHNAHLDGASLRNCNMSQSNFGIESMLQGHTHKVTCVAYSPDHKWIASGSFDKTVRIWSTETESGKFQLNGHTSVVTALAFSPDGKFLISGSADKCVRLWGCTANYICIHKFEHHTSAIMSLSFGKPLQPNSLPVPQKQLQIVHAVDASVTPEEKQSSIRQYFASGSRDCSVIVWNVYTREIYRILSCNSAVSMCVAFSPDCSILASGLSDRTLRTWVMNWDAPSSTEAVEDSDAQDSKDKMQTLDLDQKLTSIEFSASGHLAVTTGAQSVRLWTVLNGKLSKVEEFQGHTDLVLAAHFCSYYADKKIVSVSADKTIKIWKTATGEILSELKGLTMDPLCVAVCERHIVTGCMDSTVQIWDMTTSFTDGLYELKGHTGAVMAVDFSPTGEVVVSGSDDKTVRVWDALTGELRQELGRNQDKVTAVCFNPDGDLVAVGSDNIVRVWNIVTGELVHQCKGHTENVTAVVWYDEFIISGSWDKSVIVWKVRQGELNAEIVKTFPNLHDFEITSLEIIKEPEEGGYICVSSSFRDMHSVAFLVSTLELVDYPEQLSLKLVSSVAYSPNKRYKVSAVGNVVRMHDESDDSCLLWWSSSPGLSAARAAIDEQHGLLKTLTQVVQ